MNDPFFSRRFSWALALGLTLAWAFAPPMQEAGAAVLRFTTRLEENTVTVGIPFKYVIAVETDGDAPHSLPTEPDWGGLTVVAGPSQTQRMTVINGSRRTQLYFQYELVANAPGTYTIGHSRIVADGQVYESGTEPITAQAPDMSMLPESLQDAGILHPVADDPGITRQLQGRAFLLSEISKTNPYVGEPFTVTYYLYQERLPPADGLQVAQPDAATFLAEEPYIAQAITPTEIVTLDGRDYDVALIYRNVFTPTRTGDFKVEGFRIRFRLPVQNARQRRPRSGFDAFLDLDPLFKQMATIEAGTSPVEVSVQSIPDEGRPPGFSGTVGAFSLTSAVDRKIASEDDLITLSAKITGEGNPSLAAPPAFPESDDFEVFDQTEKTEKQTGGRTPGGSKTIEYLLRPKRAGTLRIPGLRYPIFNPKSEGFEILETESVLVQVTPSQTKPVATQGGGGSNELPEIEDQLDYIKPLIGLSRETPRVLYHSIPFWGIQIAGLVLALGALIRARRQALIDPAEERRRNSFGALDFKLKKLGQVSGPRATEEAAMALERALREFVADWFNLKADGLTAPEISFRLMAEGMPKEQIKRIEDIMEGCAQVRYAPTGETPADFTEWAREAQTLLKETLKP